MLIFESAIQTLKKYADYSGRASRQEFWLFFAFLLIVNAVAQLLGAMFGVGYVLASVVAALTLVPQVTVAIRRLHDVGHSGKELVVPGLMLLALPLMFGFRGILPRIVALGVFAIALFAFGSILMLLLKKGGSVPNKYGPSPAAFSYARQA